MKSLSFFVAGLPGAQGSKRHVGGGVMIESSKRVAPWRQDVRAAVEKVADGVVFDGPTSLAATFVMPHVKSDPYRWYHTTLGDLDKLVRSTLDALQSSGVLVNDSLICMMSLSKRHAVAGAPSGAQLDLVDLTDMQTMLRNELKYRAAQERQARP